MDIRLAAGISSEFVANIQHGHKDKIYNSLAEEDATERLASSIEYWKGLGKTVVFTSGVYDGMHPNHAAYLLNVKMLGSELDYNSKHNDNWDDLRQHEHEEYVRHCLATNALKLVVSLDGDKSVAVRKGWNPEKGSSSRPIFSLNTRMAEVAGLSYRSPANPNERVATVDAVTVHGEHDFPEGTPNSNLYNLNAEINPDVWGVYYESGDILEQAPLDDRLGRIAMRVISSGGDDSYWFDDVMGHISTTSMIKRIKGEV